MNYPIEHRHAMNALTALHLQIAERHRYTNPPTALNNWLQNKDVAAYVGITKALGWSGASICRMRRKQMGWTE